MKDRIYYVAPGGDLWMLGDRAAERLAFFPDPEAARQEAERLAAHTPRSHVTVVVSREDGPPTVITYTDGRRDR